jgi:hypothetical protein
MAVCQYTALLVGRPCQVANHIGMSDRILKFDGVAKGINIGIGGLQIKLNILCFQVLMNQSSHRIVQRSHHLFGHFDNGHFKTGVMQVFRHF